MGTHQVGEGNRKDRQVEEGEWVSFPGGELEGRRPNGMCPACRERQRAQARSSGRSSSFLQSLASSPQPPAPSPGPVCFMCYRVCLARERALQAARNLATASEARFQDSMPFEPINRARLERLRAERGRARAAMRSGTAQFVDRRRHAQIAARHALQRLAAGLQSNATAGPVRQRHIDEAIHAAELQLPEAWLPFIVSR